MTHVCVRKLTTTGSDNGLSPCRREAFIWTSAGILLIRPLGRNFSEILIATEAFSFKKMHLKISSAKWRPFCLGLNVLTTCGVTKPISPVPLSSYFSTLSKHTLSIDHHIDIWQATPQLSCGDACPIWMWFKESNWYFCWIKNFVHREINKLDLKMVVAWTICNLQSRWGYVNILISTYLRYDILFLPFWT